MSARPEAITRLAESRAQETSGAAVLERIMEQQAQVASRYKPVLSIDELIQREKAIQYLVDNIMVEGIDYGWIPGTRPKEEAKPGEYRAKPTLFKSGAERACAFFGYSPEYIAESAIEEWTPEKYGEPLFYYSYRCTLSKDRNPVGQGLGSASTWESKYRYRQGQRECPDCGKPGTIIKGKAEYGGGWICFAKKGGCGAKFADTDERITAQVVEKVANPDFADVINTVQKMGQKRAYVAATLTATGLSGRFTQDLEDMPPAPAQAPPTQQQPTAGTSTPQQKPPAKSASEVGIERILQESRKSPEKLKAAFGFMRKALADILGSDAAAERYDAVTMPIFERHPDGDETQDEMEGALTALYQMIDAERSRKHV